MLCKALRSKEKGSVCLLLEVGLIGGIDMERERVYFLLMVLSCSARVLFGGWLGRKGFRSWNTMIAFCMLTASPRGQHCMQHDKGKKGNPFALAMADTICGDIAVSWFSTTIHFFFRIWLRIPFHCSSAMPRPALSPFFLQSQLPA